MKQSRFVYVILIRTTPEKLWQALTDPEFSRKYWKNMRQESDWQPGSPWSLRFPDGKLADSGTILKSEPPHKMIVQWRNEWKPELNAEGYSQMTYELVALGESVRLTVIHEIDVPQSKLIEAVSNGWPQILSSLKSLLETGEELAITRENCKSDAK